MYENLANYPYPSIVILIGGFVSLLTGFMKVDRDDTSDKLMGGFVHFIGLFYGVASLIFGILTFGSSAYPNWIAWGLVIVGVSLFLKPLKDIPWASLLGLIVAGAATAYLAMNMPPVIISGLDVRWILVAVFIIVLLIIYLLFKFIEDIFELLGMLLSNKPVSILIGLGAIAIGIYSLVMFY